MNDSDVGVRYQGHGSSTFNPYDHPYREWDGTKLARKPVPHVRVKRAIDAHRRSKFWKPVHIPVKRLPENYVTDNDSEATDGD